MTIQNLTIQDFDEGIYLQDSSDLYIYNNTIADNEWGIILDSSSNSILSGNTFTKCGLYVWDSYNNTVENNTVNGKPLVYLEGVSEYIVSEDAGQVILVNCDNIRVENQYISNTTVGVELWNTNNSVISNNNFYNNYYGIALESSSYNIVSANTIPNNEVAIGLTYSSNNTISNNVIQNNDDGIDLDSSSNNTISGNVLTNNHWGIDFDYSSYKTITANDIIENNWRGIYLYESSYNLIYHNNFIDNTHQVLTYNSINTWDNGYPSGGNYWSDYTGEDSDGDGIGDTLYEIDNNNKDNYPLMSPYIPLPALPGCKNSPRDLNNDGLYEDVNGNNKLDPNDVIVLYRNMNWIKQNGYEKYFDFNGNGRLDYNDIIRLLCYVIFSSL